MELRNLIETLRRESCCGCPWCDECCSVDKGCILCEKAADALEFAAAERQAVFALGQMDMRDAAHRALTAQAGVLSKTSSLAAAVMRQAAVIISELVVG